MDPMSEPRSRIEAARCDFQSIHFEAPAFGLRLMCSNAEMPGRGRVIPDHKRSGVLVRVTCLDVCQLCPLWEQRGEP